MKRRKQIVAFIALVSLVLSSYASDVLLAGSANPRSKPSKKDSQIVPKTFATPEPDRKRHFVRLVIGKSRMTFEGQEVTWGELPDLLEKVPNRNHTVLELAAASNDIESSPDFELAKNKVISLSGRFDFEYPSIIGIHALGSKGTKPDTASQKDEQVDINVKIAKLNIKTANLNRVIKVFGDPIEYTWNNHTFTKGNLPPIYILRYPDGFSVLMNNGKVRELRHTQPGYMFRGKLQIDSSLAETLKIVGKPKRTIQGRPKPKLFQDGVLYKDIDSKKGYCYYGHKRKGVRILFNDYKVSALYVTRNDLSGRRRSRSVNISSDLKSQASEFETFAKNFIRLLAEEDFSKAAENFDPTMKEALPEAKLREIWNSIIAQNGSFVEQLGFRREKILQYETVFVTCKFKKHVFDAKVVFNSSKQISGLFFVPSQAASKYKTADYVKLDSFSEREIMVGSGQWILPGTLTLPKNHGPFPAVVLVHGAGPHDRDESIGPNKPFRDLAHGLATKGIAVLRYEKRTKAFPLQMAALMNTLTVKEETIDDVLTAVAMLRKTDNIDTSRIFVLGHSLGGYIIPRIGKLDSKITGFVIMAGSVRPLEDMALEQLSYIFSLDGIITDSEKISLEKLKVQVAKVKNSELSPYTPATELPLGVPAAYWLDLRRYQPAEMAKDISRPMLIIQGGRDYQVTEADFQLWKKTLSLQENVEFKLYKKLNHLFVEGEDISTPAEYEISGHIAEKVIEDITIWIKKSYNSN